MSLPEPYLYLTKREFSLFVWQNKEK